MYLLRFCVFFFFFSSRRRHTRCSRDWSSDVCSSDLILMPNVAAASPAVRGSTVPLLLTPSVSSTSTLLLPGARDRKSTRLNSSHGYISYAVFCLKKKKKNSLMYDMDIINMDEDVDVG